MYPPRGRGTSQAAEKSRPLGISLMCSRILLGFFHKGVSVKWDDLVTVCPTTSEKGLTQTHVMGTCHIVQDPLVPNKNILFTASATPPFHREVVFCSLPGSKCFLLGTFNIGRNCLVRKEGCLSASWPVREEEARMKKGKEEQRAGEQTGNLSFQSLLTGSGCGRPSRAESLLRGHFGGAVVRGGGGSVGRGSRDGLAQQGGALGHTPRS